MKRTPLARKGKSETTKIKDRIQALLRQIVIKRDGGCFLRNYPESGLCGGRRNDGELILQAEHLNSRIHSVSFGDSRLVVCICKRHHFFWKPQYGAKYEILARSFIGTKRAALLDRVREDFKSHKMDWKLVVLDLEQQLKSYG